jgi:hypothetical protein
VYVEEFKINEQEQMFCEEYVVDFNATQAAKRAGYSRRSAYSIGSEKLQKPEAKRYICYLMAKRCLRTGITADRVLEELAKIAFAREGVKTKDKLKALDILAKHVGLFNKKDYDYPEFMIPDVKQRAYLNAVFYEESEARSVFNLLHPADRRLIKSEFEDRLGELEIEPEPEEIIQPDGKDENDSEPDGDDEGKERDICLITVIKDLMGEESIKRQVLARLDYLFSDGPDPWEDLANSLWYNEVHLPVVSSLNSEGRRTYTSEEAEDLVLSETTQSDAPLKECPECGKILYFESGHIVCKNCGYSK